jgi:hypothetical protein
MRGLQNKGVYLEYGVAWINRGYRATCLMHDSHANQIE